MKSKQSKAAPAKAPNAEATKATPKADFVRTLPRKLTAKQVVEKAKAAGISLSEKYVYTIRAAAKQKGKGGGKKAGTGASRLAPAEAANAMRAAQASVPRTNEAEFARLVLELGFGRVDSLLASIKQKVAEVVATR